MPTELTGATGEFAQNLSDLASSDVGKQLSQSLAALAEVQRKAQDLQAAQADQDMATLMATADEYSRLIHSVRVGLYSRCLSLIQFRQARVQFSYSGVSCLEDLRKRPVAHETDP